VVVPDVLVAMSQKRATKELFISAGVQDRKRISHAQRTPGGRWSKCRREIMSNDSAVVLTCAASPLSDMMLSMRRTLASALARSSQHHLGWLGNCSAVARLLNGQSVRDDEPVGVVGVGGRSSIDFSRPAPAHRKSALDGTM